MSRVVALLVALGLLGGCSAAALSEEAAEELQQHTAVVRAAAEVGDLDSATAALAGLRTSLEARHAAGEVTDARARQIAGAAEEVAGLLEAIADRDAPPPPQPSPTAPATPREEPPPPPPPPPAPDDDDDEDGDTDDSDDDSGEEDDNGEDDDEQDSRSRGPDGEGPPGRR